LLQNTSIDFDPFELAVEEKIYRSLKRFCVIFAVAAVTLCLLDVINVRSVDAAVEFLHDSSARIVDLPNRVVALPDRIRSEIRNISIIPSSSVLPPSLSAQATAAIPRDKPIVVASAASGAGALPAAARTATAPKAELAAEQAVASLAAVHNQDAVEWAMNGRALPAALPAGARTKPAVMASLGSQPVETLKPDVDLWTKAKSGAQPEAAATAAVKSDTNPQAPTETRPAITATSEAVPVVAEKPTAMTDAVASAATNSEIKVEAKSEAQSAELTKPDLPVSLALPLAKKPAETPAKMPAQVASVDPAPASDASAAPTPVSRPLMAAIPIEMVPLPRPAPGLPPPSPAQRLHLEGKDFAKAEHCLANAVYFEARSEPVRGQMAVAQVVMNRVFSGFYPSDVCGVVYQNADHYLACQFTFACDGKRKLINERGAWARANRIAKQTLEGVIYVPEVAKSTHYHAVYVHPNWVREMPRMARYGEHAFYRPIAWGNGADEPVWGSAALAKKK
jgi:hypothetical protein